MGILDVWNYPNPQSTDPISGNSDNHWSAQSANSVMWHINGIWIVFTGSTLRTSGDPVLQWNLGSLAPTFADLGSWGYIGFYETMIYVNGRYEVPMRAYNGVFPNQGCYKWFILHATNPAGPWEKTEITPLSGLFYDMRNFHYLDDKWVTVGDDGLPSGGGRRYYPVIAYGTVDGGWTVNTSLATTGYDWGYYVNFNGPVIDYRKITDIGFDGTTWYTIARNVDADFPEIGDGEDGPLARYSTSIDGPWSTAVTTGLGSGQDFTNMKYEANTGLWWAGGSSIFHSTNPWVNGWTVVTAATGLTGSIGGFQRLNDYWVFWGSDEDINGISTPRISYQAVNGSNPPTASGWTKVSVGGRSNVGWGNWTSFVATDNNGRFVLANGNWGELRGNWSTTTGPTNKILLAVDSSSELFDFPSPTLIQLPPPPKNTVVSPNVRSYFSGAGG